ncbi:MAG TPA: cache domain-containing protein [Polyangiaceae bacterium]|nr:cache domain-containing protein [Polyangiaceae bacterium]
MTIQPVPSARPYAQVPAPTPEQLYEHEETRTLVALVNDAAERVRAEGDAAFREFRISGSRWRHGDTYVFVLDPEGNMLVHADPSLEGRNQLGLMDIHGKPIVRGLIAAATALPNKRDGWYHYQWPVPGGLLPRWKSSYVRLVQAPFGKSYIVGSGMYDDRMERAFVVDMVTNAAGLMAENGEQAFSIFRDARGPFIAKDAYVFVFDLDGVELLNPAFPNLEGRNIVDLTDTHGKSLVREMIHVVQTRGAGWVEYMWPKPGDSVSTQKSAFVTRAKLGDRVVLVGCGVYLAGAPRDARPVAELTAPELTTLVREAAAVLEEQGEKAYADFRLRGSKWFRDDTYLFVMTTDGTNVFHGGDPAREGTNDSGLLDILGRPIGKMILRMAASPSGEGWIHYMYPRPGEVFPAWKSTFVKRVTFPSGVQHTVGCGSYDMKMDRAFIEDVVDRAAALVAERGEDAFGQLRDKKGPFVFMDTYVFVLTPDGTELLNPAFPSLEGRNLMSLRDVKGKKVIQEEITSAMREGSAWLECDWFRPGDNTPAHKQTYVRRVQSGEDTFIVGAGIYLE